MKRIALPGSLVGSLALAFALSCPSPALAQDVSVFAGMSSATVVFAPESGSQGLPGGSWRGGWLAGVSFFPRPADLGGIQIEVLVHQKGVRNLLRRDDAIRLTYLEVPVLLHMDFVQKGNNAIYLIAGVAPAFNLQASYEYGGIKEDIQDDIEAVDVGLIVGGGVEIRRLTIGARYTWGLRSGFQDGDLEGTFKNRSFAVTVGWRLGR
jgi:hypothetical protein